MPVYVKRFGNRVGRLTLRSSRSDLMTQFGGKLRPADLDGLCLVREGGQATQGISAQQRQVEFPVLAVSQQHCVRLHCRGHRGENSKETRF
jgi:hypothetical protein